MIARILRSLIEKRRLDRAIAARRTARIARSAAARIGHSNEIKRRAERARAMFGE